MGTFSFFTWMLGRAQRAPSSCLSADFSRLQGGRRGSLRVPPLLGAASSPPHLGRCLSGRLVGHITWEKPAELASLERPEYFSLILFLGAKPLDFFSFPIKAFLWAYLKLIAYLLTKEAFLLVAILSNGQNYHLHTGDLNGRMKYKTRKCPDNLGPRYILLYFQSKGKVTHPAASSHVLFSYNAFMLCDLFLGMLIFYSLLSLRKP